MVKVIIELELINPYKNSLSILLNFVSIWDGSLLQGGAHDKICIISLFDKQFKSIFGIKPKRGRYKIPKNMTGFATSIKVLGGTKVKELKVNDKN